MNLGEIIARLQRLVANGVPEDTPVAVSVGDEFSEIGSEYDIHYLEGEYIYNQPKMILMRRVGKFVAIADLGYMESERQNVEYRDLEDNYVFNIRHPDTLNFISAEAEDELNSIITENIKEEIDSEIAKERGNESTRKLLGIESPED